MYNGQIMGFGGFMWLFWIVLFVIVLLLAKYLWATPGKHARESDNPAVDILRERYARGELSREEYEEMLNDLSSR